MTMTLRPKTKRRLTILLIGFLCIVGTLWSLVLYREHQARHELNLDRVRGMEAFQNKDWLTTIDQLTPYINNQPSDAEALYALALAQLSKPNPTSGDIGDALARLRRYRELAPDNIEAAHRLLDLERELRHWDQVTDLSRQILILAPNDPQSLSALATALETEGRSDDALIPAEQYNDAAPTDLEGHELTYDIMHSLKAPLSEMLRRAQKFEKQFPADPRFKIAEVLAYTIGRGGDTDAGPDSEDIAQRELTTLLSATQRPVVPPDGQFIRYAVGLLDDNRLFMQSMDLLNRAASTPAGQDAAVRLLYARRLWETRQSQQVVNLGVLATDPSASLLAYTALALHDLNRQTEADAIVNALSSRPDDPEAKAWSLGLSAAFNPSSEMGKQFDLLEQALAVNSGNGVLHFMLAQAYRKASEGDLALEEGRAAADLLPSWPAPHLMLASLLAERGQIIAALRESDMALVSAGADQYYGLEPQVVRASIAFKYAEALGQSEPKHKLLGLLDMLRAQHPQETRVLPMYVQLLSQCGQAGRAKTILADAVAHPESIGGQMILLQLVEASRDEKLGLETQLLDAGEKQFGRTPQIAFARANTLVAAGRETPAQAIAYLNESARRAAGANAWQWAFLTARFREDAHDPGAAGAWVSLGNGFPDNLTVQDSILDPAIAPMAWLKDSDLISATIERVRALTGDSALVWKLARARLLLSEGDAKSASDASFLLTDVLKHATAAQRPEPHQLQARAMERLGNLDGAANELAQAWLLSPADPQIGCDLLRVYHAASRYAEAVDTFDRLKGLPLDNDLTVKAAAVMFDQNELTRAADLLKLHDDPTNPQNQSTALIGLLAMVEQRLGQIKEAGDAYLRVLNASDLPPTVASAGADFFASFGDSATAKRFLDRLSTSSMSATDRMLSMAAFQERYGKDPAAVNQLYQDAISADPADPAPVVAYVGYLIRQHRLDVAANIAANGLKDFPHNQQLTTLQTLAADLNGPLAGDLVPLAAILTESSGNPALSDLLAAVAATTGRTDQLDQLQTLLLKHPDYYPIYEVTVRRLMVSGRRDDADKAAEVATDAMDRFHDEPLAARLACVAQAELGHWTAALTDAEQWRQRAYREPFDADWHIALCQINLGMPDEAITRLEPYVVDARLKPDEPLNRQIIRTYAGALLADNRIDDARKMLIPFASRSATWRSVWLGLAKESFREPNAAAAWIQSVTSMIPGGSTDETAILAQAWFDLAQRFDYEPGYANCRALLSPEMATGQLDVRSMLMLAMAEEQDHAPAAADDYRKVISAAKANPKADPTVLPAAENNLANILLDTGGTAALPEADRLARAAVAGSAAFPSVQSFYFDTLGHVLLKEGNPDDAADAFGDADQLRPNDPIILIGWADALVRDRKIGQALVKLEMADKTLADGTRISAKMKREHDAISAQIQKALISPSPPNP
ncbi:MAG TPA: hypothetical protein VL992_08075 [Tepidisphaeraceae bacterium]|nr:hypothetical protein [Tepidisphaeraceae bacterium]